MVVDINYYAKVGKRILTFLISILGVYLAFKLAIFYMPFLIAFIISILIEPMIRFLMKKTRLSRKVSAICVLIFVFSIIIGLLIWGITGLVSESSNLLNGLNDYFEKLYSQFQNIISHIDFSKIQIPDEVKNTIQASALDFLNTLSNFIKNALSTLINVVTSIPTVAIYVVITTLSLYFICTDKVYMLDQVEHHMPKRWVKKIGIHLKELINTLGGYLKAQIILIIISFVIVLVGLLILHFLGQNVKYPLLAALLIGFVDALPILGSGTVMVPWAIISGINGDIVLAISLLAIFAIIIVTRQILEPRIVSSHIGIHPIFTIIAMYTGFKLIGVIGMFIGPIVLIILKNIYGTMIDKGFLKSIFDR